MKCRTAARRRRRKRLLAAARRIAAEYHAFTEDAKRVRERIYSQFAAAIGYSAAR